MEVRVLRAEPAGVALEAPLGPNLNHRKTAFGGSVAALAILAGWTLLHECLRADGIEGVRTVIQASEVGYVAPAKGAFRATCGALGPEAWSRFLHVLQRRGKARVRVSGEVTSEGTLVATFRGAYAGLVDRPNR